MRARFKVVVTDYEYPNLAQEERILRAIDAELVAAQCQTEQQVVELAADADAILNQYTPLTSGVLSSLRRCKVIVRYGVGVDNIDVGAATNVGILVCNVPDYGVHEVSDHAIALLLCCIRKVHEITDVVRQGKWSYKLHRPINRIHGRTLGIVGLGRIGGMVARKAQPWGLRVLASDPYIDDEVFSSNGAIKASLEQLLDESDYVSVHVPLTSETKHMFAYEAFKRMKPSGYFINTSRGKVVDESGLHRALTEGRLAGAALDVMENEPPGEKHPLFDLPNVLITPHIAWFSEESALDLQRMAAEEVARVLEGEAPRSAVNSGARDVVAPE